MLGLTYRHVLTSKLVFRRIIWIVLDSVGIGAMPDAAAFGDPPHADTLGNIARLRGLRLPNLAALGPGKYQAAGRNRRPPRPPEGAFGRCTLASPGKDTTTGHWEMAGIHLEKAFSALSRMDFRAEIMQEFERRIGRRSLGNKAASGTEIIQELGAEHMRTGSPIVYTSADSVFQVAAHEEVIPLWELYKICETARDILRGPAEVGRVIARPFRGHARPFHPHRQSPRLRRAAAPGMLLDRLDERGVAVHSVGKIFDVFLGRGIGESAKTKNNADGMAKTLEAMASPRRRPDFRQPGGFRPAVRPSQRCRRLWRGARRIRPLAAAIPRRAPSRRRRHFHRRPRLRSHRSRHRPHARVRSAAGSRADGAARRGSRAARRRFPISARRWPPISARPSRTAPVF